MSKHEKQVRRERKKTDRARRLGARFRHPTSHIKHGPAALAAAAVIAAGTQAYASPVRFENPAGAGHFDWAVPDGSTARFLDLTLDASAQPGDTPLPGTASELWTRLGDGFTHNGNFPGGAEVEITGYSWLNGLNAGDLIPSGASWSGLGYGYYYGSGLPGGQQGYFGVRFDLGSGTQYGWVGVVREVGGGTLDAFAWGHETEVGVSIEAGAPEPGTLALLAFGAGAALRRRRA